MTPGRLSIEIHQDTPGSARLRVEGDLDSANAADLREAIADQQAQSQGVVLDLADIRFVDSLGLRVLVDAAHDQANGDRLHLIDDLPAHVRRMMAITGTLAMFRLVRR